MSYNKDYIRLESNNAENDNIIDKKPEEKVEGIDDN